jgi:hypothetical protein
MAPSVYRLFHLGDWWLTEPRFLRLYDRFRHELEAREPGWEEPPALWEVVVPSVTEVVFLPRDRPRAAGVVRRGAGVRLHGGTEVPP